MAGERPRATNHRHATDGSWRVTRMVRKKRAKAQRSVRCGPSAAVVLVLHERDRSDHVAFFFSLPVPPSCLPPSCCAVPHTHDDVGWLKVRCGNGNAIPEALLALTLSLPPVGHATGIFFPASLADRVLTRNLLPLMCVHCFFRRP
jgi:hypothetical protein